ncbi:MAG: DUF1223 domain-containing protein [Thiobacillus sp.]|nr:DUF1223 domain-containing protein [Thiobacillus sp.]
MRAYILACALLAPATQAATCTATSTPTRTTLLELYTSEGCSSCPPADRWLSQLPADSGVVPLAFHVDYWDRLGWKDPFGDAAYSQRQRARNRGAGWVYTPQVMLDGKDYRDWHRSRSPHVPAIAAPVNLHLTLATSPGHVDAHVSSRFAPSSPTPEAQLFMALYENRLSTKVAAGENARRTLNHDYVVRALVGPLGPQGRHRFLLEANWKTADLGVAAFMLTPQGDTLQALARPLCLN